MSRGRWRLWTGRRTLASGREAVFPKDFLDDLRHGDATDRKTTLRVLGRVDAVPRDPLAGIGRPELLKYRAGGVWSRRVTQEHRLVHLARGDRVDVLPARYHYGR